MKVAAGTSTAPNGKRAVEEAVGTMRRQLGEPPDFVFFYASSNYRDDDLPAQVHSLTGGAPLVGGTSFRGVATHTGVCTQDNRGLGVLGLSDPAGSFGTGIACQNDAPREAAQRALRSALSQAERPGEVPALIWMSSAPGQEEALIEAVGEIVGPEVPIVGGSTADNDVIGEWRQFANARTDRDSVALATLFPEREPTFAFHYGYAPTEHKGRVTRAAGRIVYEIDGEPAAEVYDRWTGGTLRSVIDSGGGNALSRTTLHPLGRSGEAAGERAGKGGPLAEEGLNSTKGSEAKHLRDARGEIVYLLSHPSWVYPDKGLGLFTTVSVGDELVLMTGSTGRLVQRAGQVAATARTLAKWDDDPPAGAITVYCAGCMLTVGDRIDAAMEGVRESLDGAPFLTTFTFGEQGRHTGLGNVHANLMISTVCFPR